MAHGQKRTKGTTAKTPTLAKSKRQLARLLDRSDMAVRLWMRNPRWPFGQSPPWNVADVREWCAATLSPNPADLAAGPPRARDPDTLTKAKLALYLERAQKIRLEREILAGKFTANDVFDQKRTLQIVAIKAALFALARSLPAQVTGRTLEENLHICEREITNLCNTFADDHDEKTDHITQAESEAASRRAQRSKRAEA